MSETLKIRALEALVNQLDSTIVLLDKEILEKLKDLFTERTRTNTLIQMLQQNFPESARNIISKSVEELHKQGDNECDLLQYYDATYGE
jgi:DNA-directed RNA polymerase beta' subunit